VLQLEGLSVGWGLLDRVLLPARVPGYRPEDLDMLAATGQIVWVGRGAAGPKDGRIALYRREQVIAADHRAPTNPGDRCRADSNSYRWSNREPDTDAAEPTTADPIETLRAILLDHLRRRGACFLMELQQAAERAGQRCLVSAGKEAFETALWDLVWDGLITNDTFAPLRSLGGSRGGGAAAGPAAEPSPVADDPGAS
jgi:ATP-dependent Lhr-like helicase